MAVSFRHGSNGSYKSAYAVWFEVVPALRAGRLVVTNIEGLKSLQGIEESLGEKFPTTARLIRIFSRSEEGVQLWQNWYCWMPLGAFVVIDESQDLFSADVGFKREKSQYQPVETFLKWLPPDFSELFYSRWVPVPEDQRGDDGEEDDTGRTQYDEHGRLAYPYNFYGAFMRHRKYQWDVIMLTPDWTSIPSWLKGCAQEAYSHRSTDTFFRKRKPRIYNHKPTSSKSDPTTKADFASCTSKKIPIDVFALYKSTGTGGFNESKSDLTILKSPKFVLAILIAAVSGSYFVWSMFDVFGSHDNSVQASDSVVSSPAGAQSVVRSGTVVPASSAKTSVSDSSRVVSVRNSNKGGDSHGDVINVNPFSAAFPLFDAATHVYLTGAVTFKHGKVKLDNYYFRIDMPDGSYYLAGRSVQKYGYFIHPIDECLVQIIYGEQRHIISCPPYQETTLNNNSQLENRKEKVNKTVDIFSL